VIEENGVVGRHVDISADDLEILELLGYSPPSNVAFWELSREESDGSDTLTETLDLSTTLIAPISTPAYNLQYVRMPVIVRSKYGQVAVIALFKGVKASL